MQSETRQLCDELLSMAEREKAAIGAGNLDELERCLTRKSMVLEELTSIGSGTDQTSLFASELSEVLERVRNAHNQVRDGLKSMLEACEGEIMSVGKGRKAHRAYHRGRTSGVTLKGRKAGTRRRGPAVKQPVL